MGYSRLIAVFFGTIGVGFMGSVVYAAGTGYSPSTTPVPAATPGGFSQVVTVKTIPANSTSTTTVSATVNGAPITISVAPGTFSKSVQVIVTQPVLSQITSALPSLGFSGWHAAAGLGVNVTTSSGTAYRGTFNKPVAVSVASSAVTSGDRVVEWLANGSFSSVANPTITQGKATWSFNQDPGFAILSASSSTVPGGTSPVTGKPFQGESLAGAGLLSLGVGTLYLSRRKTSRAH